MLAPTPLEKQLQACLDDIRGKQGVSAMKMIEAFERAQLEAHRNPLVVDPGGLEFSISQDGWIRVNGSAAFAIKLSDLVSDNWTLMYDD